ncbi:MAG TPA: hypothetical protein VGM06_03545 [Polyangiaceae bacterium]|jgi:hypothetical protein
MNYRTLLGWLCLSVPPFAATGCFQELDTGASSGGPAPSTFDDASSADTTCTPESQQCFEQCNAPSCYVAVSNGTIPVATETPPIFDLLGEGGSTMDPCAQIESESLAIRTQSCAQCHTALKEGAFDYVLDDAELTTQSSATYPNPATGKPWRMIVPGDPSSSWVYQRIVAGSMPPSDATITSLLGKQVGATVMRPTVSDQSVLYTWILDCLPGADAGVDAVASYGAGPGYGPPPGANGPGMGGAEGDGGGTVSQNLTGADAGGD